MCLLLLVVYLLSNFIRVLPGFGCSFVLFCVSFRLAGCVFAYYFANLFILLIAFFHLWREPFIQIGAPATPNLSG